MSGHYKTGNILVIPDMHIPAEREGFLDFLLGVRKDYKCDEVFSVGDMFDFHGINFHEKETDYPSFTDEVEIARKHIIPWKKAFRKMKICIGNHDLLIYRKAKAIGLPDSMIRAWNETFDLPSTWEWNTRFVHNDVLFMHGTGFSGMCPHINACKQHRMNVVMGHTHSVCGVEYTASERDLLWGMCVGSGIDDKKVVFNYGQDTQRKSIISCGVIVNGGKLPIVIPMEL
jgi:predicted phosphodiesterase